MEDKDMKPLVTFAIFAYNQEKYIREAVEAAFAQTYSPLEIIFSDDCSTDRTFSIMKEMVDEYTGPHKIILNKNPNNLGLIQHVNKVFLELAKGDIVVVGAGDDISSSDRVLRTWEVFSRDTDIISISMDYQTIDDKSEILNIRKTFPPGYYTLSEFYKTKEFPKIGCSRAYRKRIYEVFGELKGSYGVEDRSLTFRSLLLGKSYHIDEVGLKYRIITNSLSSVSTELKYIDAVAKQGLLDSTIAYEKNIITSKDNMMISKVLKSVQNNFHLREKLTLSKNNILFFFKKILFSRDFKFREKMGLLKSCMRSLVR